MEQTKVEMAVVDSAFASEGAAVIKGATVANKEDDFKYHFGCGPFKPKCLQRIFRSSIFFLVILSAYSVIQGAVSSGIRTLQ